jgi:hypothetical protein
MHRKRKYLSTYFTYYHQLHTCILPYVFFLQTYIPDEKTHVIVFFQTARK